VAALFTVRVANSSIVWSAWAGSRGGVFQQQAQAQLVMETVSMYQPLVTLLPLPSSVAQRQRN
jgi:hypothetical protein